MAVLVVTLVMAVLIFMEVMAVLVVMIVMAVLVVMIVNAVLVVIIVMAVLGVTRPTEVCHDPKEVSDIDEKYFMTSRNDKLCYDLH